MTKLRMIEAVRPEPGYHLEVTWKDGTTSDVDFSTGVLGHGVFAFLMDPARFASVRIGDRARTIEWPAPNGNADSLLDIDADALFELSKAPSTLLAESPQLTRNRAAGS